MTDPTHATGLQESAKKTVSLLDDLRNEMRTLNDYIDTQNDEDVDAVIDDLLMARALLYFLRQTFTRFTECLHGNPPA